MPEVNYNCSCSAGVGLTDTLLNLRKRLLRRMGYSARVDNPPPGIADLMDDHLQSAQTQLVEMFDIFRGVRYFTWDLVEGTRLYDVDQNAEAISDPVVCDKPINLNTVTWVGLKRDGRLTTLRRGIYPERYDDAEPNGIPTRYDIRQCIELWPAPGPEAMKLVVKGNIGMGRFTDDDDTTTIDSEAVFLFALATAKAHAGHPDAGNYMSMLTNRVGNLVAGSHGTNRYITDADDYGTIDHLTAEVLPIDARYTEDGLVRRLEE